MKFNVLLTGLSLALGASAQLSLPKVTLAPTVLRRADADLAGVIKQYDSAVTDFDTEVNGFSSLNNAYDFNHAAGFLVGVINGSADAVSSSTGVAITDAVSTLVDTLQTDVSTLVSDLSSKKSTFQSLSFCADLRMITSDIVSTNDRLVNAILAKVPTDNQDSAQQLASGISDSWNKAKSDFAEGSCVDGSATSTGTSSSPTSTDGGGSGTTAPSSNGSGTPRQTNQPNREPSGNGTLSAGAKAGIGIGVSLVVLIAMGLGLFLILRQRQRRNASAGQGPPHPGHPPAPAYPGVEGMAVVGKVDGSPSWGNTTPAGLSQGPWPSGPSTATPPQPELDGRAYTPGIVGTGTQPQAVEMGPAPPAVPELGAYSQYNMDPASMQQQQPPPATPQELPARPDYPNAYSSPQPTAAVRSNPSPLEQSSQPAGATVHHEPGLQASPPETQPVSEEQQQQQQQRPADGMGANDQHLNQLMEEHSRLERQRQTILQLQDIEAQQAAIQERIAAAQNSRTPGGPSGG